MLSTKVKENVKLILIILGMLLLASVTLFVSTKESNYVSAVDLEGQNNVISGTSYLTFDAGFGASKDSTTHSAVLDVDTQEPKLWLKLLTTAGGCTIYNPTFQFLTESGGYNINFDVGFGNISLKDSTTNEEFVKSSSDTDKTVHIKDLNGGLNAPLRLHPDFKNSVQTNQTCIVRFTATFQDPSGNVIPVSKDIYINVGWTANHEMELVQRVSKYKRSSATETLVIETDIHNQIKHGKTGYTLPVKQTQIVVDVPTYEGFAPDSVNVTATKTSATNGKDETNVVFNSSNWTYNSANRKLIITVNNPDASGNIEYGNGADEYNITYIYPKGAYDAFATGGTTIINKVTGTMQLYSNTSTISVTKTINDNLRLDGEIGSDNDAYTKLGLYMNALAGERKWRLGISGIYYLHHEDVTNTLGTRVEFTEMTYYSDTATYSGYDSANNVNYNPIISIGISETSFKEYLGEGGVAKIYDDNCQHLLGEITTATPKNARGHYEIDLSSNEHKDKTHSIIVELSKPQQNLKDIEIYYSREIYGGNFTLKQAQEITRGNAQIKTYYARTDDPTNFKQDTKPALIMDNITFEDSYTDASLKVETMKLDATNPNFQELKLKLVLDNVRKVYCDAWSNPYFDFEFPSYITDIDLDTDPLTFQLKNSENIYYDKSAGKASLYKDGKNIHFVLSLDGNQQQNDTPTSLEVTCKVKVDKFTPNTTENIIVRYVNEAVKNYKNESSWMFSGSKFPGLPAGTKAGTHNRNNRLC